MNQYTVDIIGLGNKGALADAPGSGNEHKYLSYCHAVIDHPGFKINSLHDIDESAERRAAHIWGGGPGERFPDVVIIATPDNKHYKYLHQCPYNYIKPKLVMCEKPLCTDWLQAMEIVDICKQRDVPILVDYTRRFIPHWQLMREIARGAGPFRGGTLTFNRGWLHTASHFIDLALWFGADIDKIVFNHIAADNNQWIFDWVLAFGEHVKFHETSPCKALDEPVNKIYDMHLWQVMSNAYAFLEGKEPLKCTGEDALKALEATYQIMGRTGK